MKEESTSVQLEPKTLSLLVDNYLEIATWSAEHNALSGLDVDIKVGGYVRDPDTDAKLVSLGLQSVQLNGELSAIPSLVIEVQKIDVRNGYAVPRDYGISGVFALPVDQNDVIVASVVLTGLEPGIDRTSPPPTRKMKRVRVPIL